VEPYVDNHIKGKVQTYFEDGALMIEESYFQSRPHGLFRVYNRNGDLILVRRYISGKLFGESQNFYPNGEMKMQAGYLDNKFHGPAQMYYEGGQLFREANYINGTLQGELKEYFPDGTLKSLFRYSDHKLNGIFEEHDKTGLLRWKRNYADGERDGLTVEYYPLSGERWYEKTYEAGRMTRLVEYKRNGDVISDHTFTEEEFEFEKEEYFHDFWLDAFGVDDPDELDLIL